MVCSGDPIYAACPPGFVALQIFLIFGTSLMIYSRGQIFFDVRGSARMGLMP